jgi:hypothetical protein
VELGQAIDIKQVQRIFLDPPNTTTNGKQTLKSGRNTPFLWAHTEGLEN